MQLELGASLWGFYFGRDASLWPSLGDAVRSVVGLDLGLGVEVWSAKGPADAGPSLGEEDDLVRSAAQARFVTVHTRGDYWTWNPAGLRAEVDFASRIGSPILVVHPGSLGLDGPESRPDVPEIARILDYARARGVEVALENTPNAMWALDRALDHFGDDPATSNLGICIDVGHAFLSTDAGRHPLRDYLRRYRGQLAHLHLHDTDGVHDSHDVPGSGWIDWEDLFSLLEEIGYVGRGILEIQHGGHCPLDGFREGVRALAALFGS